MTHLFIPYNIAVLAKQKGFDKPCMKYFYIDGTSKWSPTRKFANRNIYENQYNQPTYQELVDWFRDKHNIIVYAQFQTWYGGCYTANWAHYNGLLWLFKNVGVVEDMVWNTSSWKNYYEALTKAIEEAFKLI